MSVSGNRLIHETSPYLLQHAYNPVDWFPWGEEAFSLAKKEDKPILVSIGYSACHWCHVMERESFENADTAEYMNRHFINIKIDREERPDLDHIYMDAVQAMTGSGGWPLNIFLTTDLKPFFGGTYFPPVRAHKRPSWTEILGLITDTWTNRRDEVEAQAGSLLMYIKDTSDLHRKTFEIEDEIFKEENVTGITNRILATADKENGGFGQPPKFPQTFLLAFLLHAGNNFKDSKATSHAIFSLKKMIRGGIYDHLAGGFCRYSTDSKWLVPHFEKMLYDNALLMNVLADAYQITGDMEFADTIATVYNFLKTELMSEEGGYYAAMDADSEGEEGKYYVWTKAQLEEIAGNDADLCCEWFDVSESGNWEGKNILNLRYSVAGFCEKFQLEEQELFSKTVFWKHTLLDSRNKRVKPGIDDKILLGWNALLVSGLCKAFKATGVDHYKEEAIYLNNFLEKKLVKDNRILHTYTKGQVKIDAFLDDYAYFIQSKIHLQEITGNQEHLFRAKELTDFVITHFSSDSGLFYYTPEFQKDIIVRKIEFQDGAIPSGNSIMCFNLQYLAVVFGENDFAESGTKGLICVSGILLKHPLSMAIWADLLLNKVSGLHEIVITGKENDEILGEVLRIYLPDKILQSSKKFINMTLFDNKRFEQQPLIYICKDMACKEPVETITNFLKAI